MMGKIAFVFPGQGSQISWNGTRLSRENEHVKIFSKKQMKNLDYSLSELIFNGPQEALTITYNAQPAFINNKLCCFTEFKEAGIKPDYIAGHSLGEYTAFSGSWSNYF